MGGKRLSKKQRQQLQKLHASPKAGFKCSPSGLKAQKNKAQEEAMELRAQVERLHQQLSDAEAHLQQVRADTEQLQAAHQELLGENEALEQLAEERTHAIQLLQQDKRRLSLALRNVPQEQPPEQGGESSSGSNSNNSSAGGSGSGAGASAEDVKQRVYSSFQSGFHSFKSGTAGVDGKGLINEWSQEIKEVFGAGTRIQSVTRKYTGPVADPSSFSGEAALVLVKQQQTAWQRLQDQILSFPLFSKMQGLRVEDTAAYKRGQELVADLKEKYENSDHPIVHKVRAGCDVHDPMQSPQTVLPDLCSVSGASRAVVEEVKERLMSGSESSRAMKEIRARDPTFDMNSFVRAIKLDAPIVTQAFLKHDLGVLDLHCGPELLERFQGIFTHFTSQASARDASSTAASISMSTSYNSLIPGPQQPHPATERGLGQFDDPTILFVGDVEVVEVRQMDDDPFIITQFHCQQLKCTRDKFGNVTDGSTNSIQRVYYFWGLQQVIVFPIARCCLSTAGEGRGGDGRRAAAASKMGHPGYDVAEHACPGVAASNYAHRAMVLGIIHLTYEDFVLHLPNGQQQWRSILEKAGQQEDPGWVKQMCPFNDAAIYSIVGATCEVLGQGAEEIGRSFGRHFIDAVTRLGYGKFLRSLSSSIIGFITTLNNLHMHLSAGAPAFVMPEFRTDKVEADSLELHYRSKRAGLASWVEGIIQGLAIDYYDNMPLKMQLLRGRDDGSCDHEVWKVTFPAQSGFVKQRQEVAAASATASYSMNASLFYRLNPFHFIIDADGRLVQVGHVLGRVQPKAVVGALASDVFSVLMPYTGFSFKELSECQGFSTVLRTTGVHSLELKGQFVRTSMPLASAQQQLCRSTTSSTAPATQSNTDSTLPVPVAWPSSEPSSEAAGSRGKCPYAAASARTPAPYKGRASDDPGLPVLQSPLSTAESLRQAYLGSRSRPAQTSSAVRGPSSESSSSRDSEPLGASALPCLLPTARSLATRHASHLSDTVSDSSVPAQLRYPTPPPLRQPGLNTSHRAPARRASALTSPLSPSAVREPCAAPALAQKEVLLFIGTPRVLNLDQLRAAGLFLDDIPLHDMSSDFVVMAEQHELEATAAAALEEENAALEAQADLLLQQKTKTENAYMKLEQALEVALADRDGQTGSQSRSLRACDSFLQFTSPAEKVLLLLDKLMHGIEVDMKEVMAVRDSILAAGSDLLAPANLDTQMAKGLGEQGLGSDAEVNAALTSMLMTEGRRHGGSLTGDSLVEPLDDRSRNSSVLHSTDSEALQPQCESLACPASHPSLACMLACQQPQRSAGGSLTMWCFPDPDEVPTQPTLSSMQSPGHRPPQKRGSALTLLQQGPSNSPTLSSCIACTCTAGRHHTWMQPALVLCAVARRRGSALMMSSSVSEAGDIEPPSLLGLTLGQASFSSSLAHSVSSQLKEVPMLRSDTNLLHHNSITRTARRNSALMLDSEGSASGSPSMASGSVPQPNLLPADPSVITHVKQQLDLPGSSISKAASTAAATPTRRPLMRKQSTVLLLQSSAPSLTAGAGKVENQPHAHGLGNEAVAGEGGKASSVEPGRVASQSRQQGPNQAAVAAVDGPRAHQPAVAIGSGAQLMHSEDAFQSPAEDGHPNFLSRGTTRVAPTAVCKDVITITKNPSDLLANVLAQVEDSTFFNAFELDAVTNQHPLSVLAFALFVRSKLVARFRINELRLARFLCTIEAGYRQNPYHNRMHAADVLRTLHVIMTRGGILKAMGAAQEVALLSVYFSAVGVQGLATLYFGSAPAIIGHVTRVVHDYQHKGLNNDFLCKTGDELALRYNDRSPMENHHVAAAFELMLDPAVNIFSDTSKKAREVLRKFAIELILATDMKQHFAHNTLFKTKTPALLVCAKAQPDKRASLTGAGTKQMAELSAVATAVVAASSFRARVSKAATGDHVVVAKEQSHDGRQAHMEVTGHRQSMRPSLTQIGPDSLLVQSSGDSTPVLEPHEQLQLEIQDDELRILVLQMALKCADLGHLAHSRDVHRRWVTLLEEELFLQGDQERALGFPVSALMDRTKGGITKSQAGFFSIVVVPQLQAFVSVFPACHYLLDQAKDNYSMWLDEAAAASTASSEQGAAQPAAGVQPTPPAKATRTG
ncbi:hypothetical protein QJQ45_016330 [Haematococcus lacustris]|nr:hypothetical protein QJQ45_016330 [Haematococcus lacustris]